MNTEVEISFGDVLKILKSLGYYLVLYPIKHADTEETTCEDECACACEAQQETPNPFIVQHEQERAELAKLGLNELEYFEQGKVKRKAEEHIEEHRIEDEDEKVKVHHRMRDHYLKYKEYVQSEK